MEPLNVGDWIRLQYGGDHRLWRVAGFASKTSPLSTREDLASEPLSRVVCEVGIPGTLSYQQATYDADELVFVAKGTAPHS